jgi:hypothetical protein
VRYPVNCPIDEIFNRQERTLFGNFAAQHRASQDRHYFDIDQLGRYQG